VPLIGLVDPSHDERAEHMEGRLPAWLTLEEVQERALHAGPKWSPWTYELLAAALAEEQDPERGKRVSTSMLVSACPRSTVLQRLEPYIGTIDDMWSWVRGSYIHYMLQAVARPNSLAEWRFRTTLDGLRVSGSPDLITEDTLWDYKVTENPPVYQYPWRKHTLQVQFNRFIVNQAESWHGPNGEEDIPINPRTIVFKHCTLVYLGPKWPKVMETEKKQEFTTPNQRVIKKNMPYVWSDDEVVAEMQPRLEAMTAAMESYPDFPEGAERLWKGEATWKCPGPPHCYLPNCAAKRWPGGLTWENQS
jgi:hypothetical protein